MTKLKRPLTVIFSPTISGRTTELDVLDAVTRIIKKEDVKGIQITGDECRITLVNDEAKQLLKQQKLIINDRSISVSNADKNITSVTIKEAPLELDDLVITTTLKQYGTITHGSLTRGKIKGTNIENGTRYLDIEDAVEDIPVEQFFGKFSVKIYCNNGRTRCKHCSLNDHVYFRCPYKPSTARKCYRCDSESHSIKDCTNEVVCRYCFQSGHRQSECDDWKEKKKNEKYGNYWHDIKEGRHEENNAPNNEDKTPDVKNRASNGTTSREPDSPSSVTEKVPVTNADVGVPIPVVNFTSHWNGECRLNTATKINTDTPTQLARCSTRAEADSQPTKSSSEIVDKTEKLKTLVLGASNMKSVNGNQHTMIIAESGNTLQNINGMLRKAETKSGGKLTPDNIVVHLGTNDIIHGKDNQNRDTDIILNVAEAMGSLEKEFPKSQIYMCSIPPRKGRSDQTHKHNQTARSINSFMDGYCQRNKTNLSYINTWALLTTLQGSVINRYFEKDDSTGLHFNKDGRSLIWNLIESSQQTPADSKRKASHTSPAANTKLSTKIRMNSPETTSNVYSPQATTSTMPGFTSNN